MGSRVAVLGEPGAPWVLGFLSIVAAGATVVPLDDALDPEDAVRLAERANASALYVSARRLEEFYAAAGTRVAVRALEPLTASLPADFAPTVGLLTIDPELPAVLLFTSGTTGNEKPIT